MPFTIQFKKKFWNTFSTRKLMGKKRWMWPRTKTLPINYGYLNFFFKFNRILSKQLYSLCCRTCGMIRSFLRMEQSDWRYTRFPFDDGRDSIGSNNKLSLHLFNGVAIRYCLTLCARTTYYTVFHGIVVLGCRQSRHQLEPKRNFENREQYHASR